MRQNRLIRVSLAFVGLTLIVLLLLGCPMLPQDDLENPADPDSGVYLGYDVVDDPSKMIAYTKEGAILAQPVFTVSKVLGAQAYWLQVAPTQDFTGEGVFSHDTFTTNVIDARNLEKSFSPRYWRVCVKVMDSWSPWTTARRFTWLQDNTVYFDSQGEDTRNPPGKSLTMGDVYGQLPLVNRVGYLFDGWWPSANGTGQQVVSETIVTTTQWHVLYAKWTANTYTVALDRQGGSGGSASVSATYDQPMPFAAAPTKAGSLFGGYYDAPGGDGTQYYTSAMDSASPWDKTANTTLYAKWTPVYTVTFNSTGGSAVSVAYAEHGTKITEPTSPTKLGHAFAGWYEESECIHRWDFGVDGIGMHTTLWAKWTANTYTVKLAWQGGSGGNSSVTAIYDEAMPDAVAPTHSGYTFDGYYDTPTGSGTQYYSSSMGSVRPWDRTDTYTLYARWIVNTYTVTLDSKGGSGGSASVSAPYGRPMPSATAPTRTGYAFGGYYDAPGGDGTQYYTSAMDSASPWDKTANTTLYAKWTPVYTVTFNSTGGSAVSVAYAEHGTKITEPTSPTKLGHAFAGWYEESECIHRWDFGVDGIGMHTTLWAKWTANTYTVKLAWQGGSGGNSSVTATYDEAMPDAVAPTHSGYTFDGYYDTPTGSGTQYYSSSMGSVRPWDRTDTYTLYARWIVNTYTVTLDSKGGSGGSASVSAPYGRPMPSATAPTRTGYAFGGYYDAPGGDGTQYYTSEMGSANNWNKTTTTTLYAKWTALKYTVTLDRQEGSGGSSSVSVPYGSPMPSATAPTRTGYAFEGYYDSTGEDWTQYYTSSMDSVRTWDKVDDGRLYAKWRANTYRVTLDWRGGGGGSSEVGATYGSPLPKANAPTRNGYFFDGYYDSIEGNGIPYYTISVSNTINSGRHWDKATNATLYAKWVQCRVGGLGPGGGYIFHDKGWYSDGWRYLEAAPSYTEASTKVWGGYGTSVGGTGTGIGTGEANTERVVGTYGNAEPFASRTDYAAQFCSSFVHRVYTDWFLPSKEELAQIYSNLYQENLGGFADAWYWSSSEHDDKFSYFHSFSNGFQGNIGKSAEGKVRAVRAF